jgi:hypothetical protein
MVDFDVVTGPAPPLRLPCREPPPARERPRRGVDEAPPPPQENPLPAGERDG